MNCIICKEAITNIENQNVFTHKYIEYNICNNCIKHILSNGKFARVDNLKLKSDSFSDKLKNAIGLWIEYKAQKGDTYTEKGKQSLITQISNQVKATSESVVIAKITNSIAKNWKGICWEDNSFLKNDILELFETTWQSIVLNVEGKEEAKRYYLYLFKTFSDIEKVKIRARQIYLGYKDYIDNLSDEKYCKTFYNWLKAEVPTTWEE